MNPSLILAVALAILASAFGVFGIAVIGPTILWALIGWTMSGFFNCASCGGVNPSSNLFCFAVRASLVLALLGIIPQASAMNLATALFIGMTFHGLFLKHEMDASGLAIAGGVIMMLLGAPVHLFGDLHIPYGSMISAILLTTGAILGMRTAPK